MKTFIKAFTGLVAVGCAFAAMTNANANSSSTKKAWDSITASTCPEGVSKPSIHCSSTVASYFAPDGKLWLTWVNDGRVYLSSTTDQGRTLSPPTPVNPAPQAVDHNGENRPKALVAANGDIFVTYTIKAQRKYTGDVLFSRSTDGGKTFSSPRSLSDATGATSLRFESLNVNDAGTLFVTWLDKRDLFAAKAAKQPYSGSAIYYTYSQDRGATFAPTIKIADSTCECCRTAVEMNASGNPVIIWRHIFADDGSRDHAVSVFKDLDTPGAPVRVSADKWPVEACPHHGPSLSIDENGTQHITWFTMGDAREGGFYARSTDGGKTFRNIQPVGNNDMQAEHPYTLSHGDKVYVTWKEFDGENSLLKVMSSSTHGESWTAPSTVLKTADDSDHPFLVAHDGRVFASWRSALEGWRLVEVGDR